MADLETKNNGPQSSTPPSSATTNNTENGSSRAPPTKDTTPDKRQEDEIKNKIEELVKKFGLSEKSRSVIESEFNDDDPKDSCIQDMTRTIHTDKKKIQELEQQLEQLSKEVKLPKDEVAKSFKKMKNGDALDTLGIPEETINTLEELMKKRAQERLGSNAFNYKTPNVPEGEIEETPDESLMKKQLDNADVIITSLFNTLTAASDFIRGNEQGYSRYQDFKRKRMGTKSAFYDVLTNNSGFDVHDTEVKKNKAVSFSRPPPSRERSPFYSGDSSAATAAGSSSSSSKTSRSQQNSHVPPPPTSTDDDDLSKLSKKQRFELLNYI